MGEVGIKACNVYDLSSLSFLSQELESRRLRESHLSPSKLESLRSEAGNIKKVGNDLYQRGENQEAEEEYTKALEVCPLCFKEDRAVMFANRAAAKIKMVKRSWSIVHAKCINPFWIGTNFQFFCFLTAFSGQQGVRLDRLHLIDRPPTRLCQGPPEARPNLRGSRQTPRSNEGL